MPNSLVEWLEEYTYDKILTDVMDRVPAGMDKREGSVIYDALAPSAYEIAQVYMVIKNIILDTFPQTSSGRYLELKVKEQGLDRLQATNAINLAEFRGYDDELTDIPIGSRFSTTNLENGYVYAAISKVSEGRFLLESEAVGSDPNRYVGDLLPLSNINGLVSAKMIGNEVSGREIETDEDLRARYLVSVREKPFGGNVVSYVQESKSIDGVGGVQVFSAWDGPGTVGLQIVDNDFLPVSKSLTDTIEQHFDPDRNGSGSGISPIGHHVTVMTPTTESVNITASVTINADLSSVEAASRASLEQLFKEIQADWDTPDEVYRYKTTIYSARVLMTLLQTNGITNVTSVSLNEASGDVVWNHTMLGSVMPVLGEVRLVVAGG